MNQKVILLIVFVLVFLILIGVGIYYYMSLNSTTATTKSTPTTVFTNKLLVASDSAGKISLSTANNALSEHLGFITWTGNNLRFDLASNGKLSVTGSKFYVVRNGSECYLSSVDQFTSLSYDSKTGYISDSSDNYLYGIATGNNLGGIPTFVSSSDSGNISFFVVT